MAIWIASIFAGVSIGITIYCLREVKGLNNLVDLYESHVCDLIEQIQRLRDEGYND